MKIDLFPISICKKQICPTENQSTELDELINSFLLITEKNVWAGESGQSTGQLTKMLHEKHPELHWITQQTMQHVIEYWKQIHYTTEHDINLETCWMNFHGYGDKTDEHSHSSGAHKADISAVYYYKKNPNTGHIQFRNPLEYIHSLTPYFPGYDQSEDFRITIPTETYDLLIFPSWLKHRTLPNLSDDMRIAVSMNFQLVKYVTDGR